MRFPFAIICLFVFLLMMSSTLVAQSHTVTSPDGTLSITIGTDQSLTYSVSLNGSEIIAPSPISMTLETGRVLGNSPRVVQTARRDVDEIITPVVAEKTATIRDTFSEMSLELEGEWGLDVRAYDDGVAYRFRTSTPGDLTIKDEQFTVIFKDDHEVFFPAEEGFLTHSERLYECILLSSIAADKMASMPVLVTVENGPRIAITESNLRDYPGMYLTGTGGSTLRSRFRAYPLN